MGALWWHLDMEGVDELKARMSPMRELVGKVRGLAAVRLRGWLQAEVQKAATVLNDDLGDDVVVG